MWTQDLIVKEKKDPDEYPFWRFWYKQAITREDDSPYLNRITILGVGKWFSIKYHNVVASDDACLHDHPWTFVSIILKGGYWEHTYLPEKIQSFYQEMSDKTLADINMFRTADGKVAERRFYAPGSILIRPQPWPHRLELEKDENGNEIPCNTLIFTGPVRNKWGFFTKMGKIYWKLYKKKEHC